MYEIQYLSWYNWITIMYVPEDGSMVAYYLEQAKAAHPENRVRCVDSDGRLIDSLN